MEYKSGTYDFKTDIKTGEQGEDFIIKRLQDIGFKLIDKRKDNLYDFKMLYRDKEYTYEIKTDVYPRDTGNLVVEFESRNKPSGISVTQADYFVTFFPHLGQIWNIKTGDLKALIKKINPDIFNNSGDKGSNTKLYKLKKSEVLPYFKLHKI